MNAPALARPLLALVAASLAAAALLAWATAGQQRRDAAYQRVRAEHQAARVRLEEARRNLDLYRRHLDDFRRLEARGFIGPEARLRWVELLQGFAAERRLPRLEYDIGPQAPAAPPGLDMPEGLALNVSELRVRAGLVHEGDAFALWRLLREQAPGLASVARCRLERVGDGPPRPGRALVDLDCLFEMYTVQWTGS